VEFGVEFGYRVGDLLARVLVAVGPAFGVGGEQVGAGGHQLLVFLAGFPAVGERFGVQMPALAALRHP
jgi:hypothetical protein